MFYFYTCTMNTLMLPKFQSVVDNKLIRGRAVTCPYRLYKMKHQGINQIIDLRNSSFFQAPLEKFFCKILGIKYLRYPYSYRQKHLPDNDFFEKINKTIINNTDGYTYLHCQHGRSRTGLTVSIYEKTCTRKNDDTIFENLFNHGFSEFHKGKKGKKAEKQKNLIFEMIERYF